MKDTGEVDPDPTANRKPDPTLENNLNPKLLTNLQPYLPPGSDQDQDLGCFFENRIQARFFLEGQIPIRVYYIRLRHPDLIYPDDTSIIIDFYFEKKS